MKVNTRLTKAFFTVYQGHSKFDHQKTGKRQIREARINLENLEEIKAEMVEGAE